MVKSMLRLGRKEYVGGEKELLRLEEYMDSGKELMRLE